MMKWTERQRETIETRDKNILVSAAAGSGKTAVLVERIKQLIIGDKVDIDRFLITTFTKAAASEMKERLEDAIRKEMAEERADREFLARQLRLIPIANISTFHSFTIEVMKRYFYLTDLEPGVAIGDETRTAILKSESVEAVFDRRFEEDYERFAAFLTRYSSSRNESRIKEGIVKLYDEMRSVPHYMDWAEERIALMGSESPVSAYGLGDFLRRETEATFSEAFSCYERVAKLLKDHGLDKLAVKAEENLGLMKSIPRRLEETGAFPAIKYASLSAAKDEKEEYELIKSSVKKYAERAKKLIKDLGEKYYVFSLEQCDDELRGQAGDHLYLLELLREFEDVYREKKAALSIVDFDDVMHCAIDILSDETAAGEYRDKFRYIFVDEYQDCNQLQETIVEKIARNDNLFMVGDLKQSIYRFRLAEPELFRRRYENNASEDAKESINIDLNSNFRSKRSVTDTVNAVFSEIMTSYDENARLYCTAGDEHPGIKTSLHVIPKDAFEGEEDEFSDAESALIAKMVRDNLGLSVYDTKKGEEHTLEYGDIVVLTRNNGTVAALERYLNNCGIPAYGQTSGGYLETVEIQVFLNMLRIINNTRQDIPLISVMRSVAFGFGVRDLAAVRIFCREGSFYQAVKDYEETGPDEELRNKISSMFETIAYWKQLNMSVSLEELVRTILESTGYFDYCSGLPVGSRRIANLRLLVEKAAEFESVNYSGLHGFLEYVEAMKNSDIKVAEAAAGGDGENAVRIMTIHKSKGLEFPVVILAGTGKKLNSSKSDQLISMHKDYSIGLPHVNRKEGWHRKTLLQKAIQAKKKREAVEEEIRVLYVALTRAKDRLVITGTVGKEDSLDENIIGYSNFLQMIYGPLSRTDADIVIETEFAEAAGEEQGGRLTIDELIEKSREERDEEKFREIDRRLSATYRFKKSDIRSKCSVSQLNSHESDDKRVQLGRALFAGEGRKLSAAEIGTAMHAVMERIDFSRALAEGKAYIEHVAGDMKEKGLLTEAEHRAVNIDHIAGFFETDMGIRAAKAAVLHKEREFIMSKEIDGEETVVQGIIDCYFEEEDGIVLIDYKNSYIGESQTEDVIRERYEGQIQLYSEALEGAGEKHVKEAYLYLFHLKKFIKMM